MEYASNRRLLLHLSALFVATALASAQDAAEAERPDGERDPPPRGGPGFGPGGFPGGPPFSRREVKLVEKFDTDGDGRLGAAERKAAGAFLEEERESGRGGFRRFGGFRGRRPGGRGDSEEPPRPGRKLSPGDVEWYPDEPLYAPHALRTFFLEFENEGWEKELEDFKNTDVEVPGKLTVDGKVYPDVGVRFRGATSFMTVGEGRKRPLNVSLNFVHKKQRLGGYRTLNLLNSHEDPTFLRTVLYSRIARAYIPALNANFVRVVINGESWGVYVNAQQFNKDFAKEWFGTAKGARWKVPGSPRGRGSLAYLGDDPDEYRSIYALRSKDEPESWEALIRLCKVLSESPPEELEKALEPLLDIDGALKFLAIENVLINNDGYWTRTSDYNLYRDENGRFHLVPHDTNETFSVPGGPGFGARGRGGFGSFGRGQTARAILSQADADGDGRLGKEELTNLADVWFSRLDAEAAGKVSRDVFVSKLGDALGASRGAPTAPPRPSGDGPPRGSPRPESAGPDTFIREGIFAASDHDEDGELTRAELRAALEKWFDEWAAATGGSLSESELAAGLRQALPRPAFGGSPGGDGSDGRSRPRGPGGDAASAVKVDLDPLIAADDPGKPLLSKLLAVPALRERYLGYVREIATKWLDWEGTLGPIAEKYLALISEEVAADTRKLDSTEDFRKGLTENLDSGGGFGPRVKIALKNFAAERRKYLLKAK